MYIENVNKHGKAIAGSEDISTEKALNEFVMLELRSSGLNVMNFENLFGKSWLKEKYSYFEMLEKKDFVKIKNGIIGFTPKGYAVCDEILASIF